MADTMTLRQLHEAVQELRRTTDETLPVYFVSEHACCCGGDCSGRIDALARMRRATNVGSTGPTVVIEAR